MGPAQSIRLPRACVTTNIMSRHDLTRRSVLRGAAAGLTATGLAGIASADDTVELNVGFDGSPGKQAAADAADDVVREFNFDAMTIRAPRSAIEGLENNPNVRYVEENGRMHALGQTTPYGIEQVDADVVIDDGETGDGVSVSIIDTGIDPNHETLSANLGEGWAAVSAACQDDCDSGWTCAANEIRTCYEEWDDDQDHGTHVAGTAGAVDNNVGVLGVAPDATLHAVKVLDCCGSGDFSDIAAGIEWSADQGHDVINMSLGGGESDAVNDACDYAAQQGVVIVAAAGNDGPSEDTVSYPAAHEEVIAVSATDENDDIAEFSSRGPEVEIAAPGADVLSAVARDGYEELSGTSMASPHVAGAAAQVIASGITDREEVRQRLKDTADDVDLDDTEQGAGRLNVADAVDHDDDDDDDDDDDVLEADPDTGGSESTHTWTLDDASDDFAGEVDDITVAYPSGTSLSGLTNDDVTVHLDRDGDGTTDEITVNSDEYAGSEATFRLDGRFNTSVEGELRVEIDGVVNPSEGDYTATITLDGDDAHSVDAAFDVEEGDGDEEPDVLEADPDTAWSESFHTWTLSDPSGDFAGEVDDITVDYPSETSLDGLTNDDVTVHLDRDGDGTTDEITVNSDEYADSEATFRLDGRFNTSVEGELRVEIDGVENPGSGLYTATITLDGDDFHAVDAEFDVQF